MLGRLGILRKRRAGNVPGAPPPHAPAPESAGRPEEPNIFHTLLYGAPQAKLFRDISQIEADFGYASGEAADDRTIVTRALAAYRSQDAEISAPSAMWKGIFDYCLAPIHETLMKGAPDEISALLREPHKSNMFFGFDSLVATFVDMTRANAASNTILAKIPKDHLIRLAEIVGALPFEPLDGTNPDVRIRPYGLMHPDQILQAFDDRLGIELKFANPFPDEFGLATGRGIISYQVPHALYHACRVRELLQGVPNPRVLEIGGGLGRAAYFARQLGIKDYTIVDLPLTSLCQGYFLMRALGDDAVALRGEPNAEAPEALKLIHPSDWLNERGKRYDLVLNANSLTEMSKDAALGYWN